MLARLYAILDTDLLAARSLQLAEVATAMHAAGVALIQYRRKQGSAREMLRRCQGTARDISGGRKCPAHLK